MNILKRGSTGPEVEKLQAALASQGAFTGTQNGIFGPKTERAVIYFQQTHLGKDGEFLEADGQVGPKTWWALENPSGEAQKSGIIVPKPTGLTPIRRKVLEIAFKEHKAGVCEVPDGANSGDGVDKYIKGFGPAYWCMLFVTWVRTEAGLPLLGIEQMAHCLTVWNKAKVKKAQTLRPIPGDVFIMLYKNSAGRLTGSGHTGIVSAIAVNERSFNAIEGNAGNRVKQTLRYMSQSTLVGFINDYPEDEQPTDFERGVVQAESGGSTR